MIILNFIGIFVSLTIFTIAIFFFVKKRMLSSEYKIAKRIEEFEKESSKDKAVNVPFIVKGEQLSKIPVLEDVLQRLSIARKIESVLQQADSPMKVGNLILLMAGSALMGCLLGLIIHKVILAVLLFFCLGSVPLLNLLSKRNKRRRSFVREFPDALDMMISAIKAGHALTQAIQLVGSEAPDPVGTEFKKTFEQYNLGLDFREALMNLTKRLDSLDLKLFVTAVLLQRETGGNLTEILTNISYTIRERFKLMGQIRTYTAQGRMSAFLLGTMPVAFVLVISVLNPGYLTPLFKDKIGHFLIYLAASMQIVGFIIIRRIVHFKFQ